MDGKATARPTKFAVRIEGIDPEPVPRRGDVSATGVYFELDSELDGGVGTMHRLHLVSADGGCEAHVMATIVRRVSLDDADMPHTAGGVAYEFLPESDAVRAELGAFVDHVVASSGSQTMPAPGGSMPPVSAAEDAGLRLRSFVLETTFALAEGEPVRIDIATSGMTRRLRIDARAAKVVPIVKPGAGDVQTYEVHVVVDDSKERPGRPPSSMTLPALRPEERPEVAEALRGLADEELSSTVDELLSSLIRPPAAEDSPIQRKRQLVGKLSQLRLPMLCSLFAMERLTGKLVIDGGEDGAIVYLRDGDIVDVEPIAEGSTPRTRISQVLAWEDGTFELYLQPVKRPNRIKTSTTALLLDLAREADEARHDAENTDGG